MFHIFVPESDVFNRCYIVQSDGVIRAYDHYPTNNTSYEYRDYYIKSDYMFKDGSGTWSNYSTLPNCLDDDLITHEFWYRYDIDKIIICFIGLVFIVFYPIKKILFRLFRRFN